MHLLNGKDFGRLLFRFVVVADTHLNSEDGRSSSPFAVNARANERGQAAIRDINRWSAALVVHVGDIVHPVPELPSFKPACERFKAMAAELKAPLYVAAGNHDVGDKCVDWMPAGTVTEEFVEQYREIFGPDFFSFDAEGCHFIVINAQTINSGLKAEREQRAWLEDDFAKHRGERTFVFTHYPPYVSDRHEPSNYDNIDEPGRTWLLDLISSYKVEALFAGHVHHQWYDVYSETEFYILPSTAFARQDYAELFKVEPLGEYGRDDTPKLGYYVVDVHERGHVAHFIRTSGAAPGSDILASAGAPASPVHTKTNLVAPVGVDMRHAWIEWIDVAATGGVQEFERKRTRNDYPALALWEMGVRKLRVPLQDLLDPPVRARMALLERVGHRFTAYIFGAPSGAALAALYEYRGLIEALEVIVNWDNVWQAAQTLAVLRGELGLRIFLSKLRRQEDAKHDGSRFTHIINHGFVPAERAQLEAFLATAGAKRSIDGFVVRLPWNRSPWIDARECRELGAALGVEIALQVRLAADNPAQPVENDRAIANRVAETVFAAFSGAAIEVFFDTFVDVDRNYFPHHGFVDRRYDPRLASYVYRHLHGALAGQRDTLAAGESGEHGQVRWLAATGRSSACLLLLPADSLRMKGFELPPALATTGRSVDWIDLGTGVRHRARRSGASVFLDRELTVEVPALMRLG